MSDTSFKVKNSLNIEPSSVSTSQAGDIRVRLSDGRVVSNDGLQEKDLAYSSEIQDFAVRSLSNVTIPGLAATDLIKGAGAASLGRIPAGAENEILQIVGGAPTWAPNSGGGANTSLSNLTIPSLAATDIIVGAGASAVGRLPVGSNGQVLKVVGGTPAWGTVSQSFTASQIAFTPAGNIAATDVQAAIQELDSEKQVAGNYANQSLSNLSISGLASQDLLVGSGATSVARLPIGSAGQVLTVSSSQVVWQTPLTTSLPPTVQRFTSGSGTYTLPSGPAPIYLRVTAVGGGAGGNADGGSITGTDGTDTTFGAIITAGKGTFAPAGGGTGGSGGTFTLGGGVTDINSQNGGRGGPSDGAVTGRGMGGAGGSNLNAVTMAPTPVQGNGDSGPAGSGSGGSGAGSNGASTISGEGGGAGGYVYAQINSPAASYAYSIGTGGTGGVNVYTGGAGGSGLIIIEEYYS